MSTDVVQNPFGRSNFTSFSVSILNDGQSMYLLSSERSEISRCSPGFLFGTVNRIDCHLKGFLALSITIFLRNCFMKRSSIFYRFCRSLFNGGGGFFQDQLRPILTIPSWAAPRQCFRKGNSLAPTWIFLESFSVVLKITAFAFAVIFRFTFVIPVILSLHLLWLLSLLRPVLLRPPGLLCRLIMRVVPVV